VGDLRSRRILLLALGAGRAKTDLKHFNQVTRSVSPRFVLDGANICGRRTAFVATWWLPVQPERTVCLHFAEWAALQRWLSKPSECFSKSDCTPALAEVGGRSPSKTSPICSKVPTSRLARLQ